MLLFNMDTIMNIDYTDLYQHIVVNDLFLSNMNKANIDEFIIQNDIKQARKELCFDIPHKKLYNYIIELMCFLDYECIERAINAVKDYNDLYSRWTISDLLDRIDDIHKLSLKSLSVNKDYLRYKHIFDHYEYTQLDFEYFKQHVTSNKSSHIPMSRLKSMYDNKFKCEEWALETKGFTGKIISNEKELFELSLELLNCLSDGDEYIRPVISNKNRIMRVSNGKKTYAVNFSISTIKAYGFKNSDVPNNMQYIIQLLVDSYKNSDVCNLGKEPTTFIDESRFFDFSHLTQQRNDYCYYYNTMSYDDTLQITNNTRQTIHNEDIISHTEELSNDTVNAFIIKSKLYNVINELTSCYNCHIIELFKTPNTNNLLHPCYKVTIKFCDVDEIRRAFSRCNEHELRHIINDLYINAHEQTLTIHFGVNHVQ